MEGSSVRPLTTNIDVGCATTIASTCQHFDDLAGEESVRTNGAFCEMEHVAHPMGISNKTSGSFGK